MSQYQSKQVTSKSKQTLRNKYSLTNITYWLPIVPQTFERISVKDKVVTEYIVTEGRKFPLTGPRQTWKKLFFVTLKENLENSRNFEKIFQIPGKLREFCWDWSWDLYFTFLQLYISNGLVYCLLCIMQLQLNSSTYIFSSFDLIWLCMK